MEIPEKLRDYINANRAPLPPITDPDQPLQIDSLGLIRMVAFLESDLGIRIEDEELLAENFESVRKLGELLATKAQNAEVPPPVQPAIPAFTARREGDRAEVSKS
jgi:acyl carrier protein